MPDLYEDMFKKLNSKKSFPSRSNASSFQILAGGLVISIVVLSIAIGLVVNGAFDGPHAKEIAKRVEAKQIAAPELEQPARRVAAKQVDEPEFEPRNVRNVSSSKDVVETSTPSSLTLVSAKYTTGVQNIYRADPAAYFVTAQVRNAGWSTETKAAFQCRAIRPGRPTHDYLATIREQHIKGGVVSGETIEVSFVVHCQELRGDLQARDTSIYDLRDGAILQVSIDGKNWVNAKYFESNEVDPMLEELTNGVKGQSMMQGFGGR